MLAMGLTMTGTVLSFLSTFGPDGVLSVTSTGRRIASVVVFVGASIVFVVAWRAAVQHDR